MTTFQSIVELVLRLYKAKLLTVFDPILRMICLIPSKCWGGDDNIVEIFVISFFSQV